MKKIGLVGGTGPESTLMYYRELNERVGTLTNGEAMPDLAIESVNFPKAWKLVSEGRYEELTAYLSEKVEALKAGGAEVISLTAATMHIVIDGISERTKVKLVSIPQAVCSEALKRGYKTIGLLGTIFSMEMDYMKKDLENAGIRVVVPEKEERLLVARRIYEELERGVIKGSTLREFNEIISLMRDEQGIEAVVLGCTELPLLLNNENCILPVLDSVDIHIDTLIELAKS